jgi:redox-sensitive bicupin YhaK (pirin superfamily)
MYHGHVVPGFPQHPHRGFETVTIARRGYIDHSDSLGAAARFGRGDVQWLTAGKGISHSEMFPLRERDQANPVELFQIWLNLPKADKLAEPHFSMLWDEKIPRHVDGKTEVTIVAGSIGDAKPPSAPPKSWASREDSDVAIWTIVMKPGAAWQMPPAKAGTNRTLYLFKGLATVDGVAVKSPIGLALKGDAAALLTAGPEGAEFLLLQGKPINEPVVAHGPFVMNTRQEIQQAFMDYQRTRFGGWPWQTDDPVHPRDEGRFARRGDEIERP